MTAEEHRSFLETDFDETDNANLADIMKVKVDRSLDRPERVKQYLDAVKNPYLVKVGDVAVKVRFANNGTSFEDAFERLLLMS